MRSFFLLLPIAAIGFAGCSLMADPAKIDYDQLRGGMSPPQVRALPPKKALICKVPTSGRGLSVCEVPLTELDGLKAAQITYVFRDDKLIAAKAEYSPGAFDAVAKMMDSRYQREEVTPAGQGIWKVADGAVVSSATDLEHGNVYTYWMSLDEMKRAQAAGY